MQWSSLASQSPPFVAPSPTPSSLPPLPSLPPLRPIVYPFQLVSQRNRRRRNVNPDRLLRSCSGKLFGGREDWNPQMSKSYWRHSSGLHPPPSLSPVIGTLPPNYSAFSVPHLQTKPLRRQCEQFLPVFPEYGVRSWHTPSNAFMHYGHALSVPDPFLIWKEIGAEEERQLIGWWLYQLCDVSWVKHLCSCRF